MATRAPSLFAGLPQGLFQSMDMLQSVCGFSENPPPHPPPCEEVLPSQVVQLEKYVAEPVNLPGGLSLLKGRVNTADVFGVSNSDLVPGKYEGGLKLWESSTDLVNALKHEIQDGQLSFKGKKILELGCGHGLPAIFACLEGASTVHFQDFNAEVLRCLTIPNVNLNLEKAHKQQACHTDNAAIPTKTTALAPDIHFYAGDWGELHSLLSVVATDQVDLAGEVDKNFLEEDVLLDDSEEDVLLDDSGSQDGSSANQEIPASSNQIQQVRCTRRHSQCHACEWARDSDLSEGGYDIILMAETVYSVSSFKKLYGIIKKCLRPPNGVVYLAAKKHYFGVGGGTRQFKSFVEEDGILGAHLVVDIADGASNVREIWKFFFN